MPHNIKANVFPVSVFFFFSECIFAVEFPLAHGLCLCFCTTIAEKQFTTTQIVLKKLNDTRAYTINYNYKPRRIALWPNIA